METWIRIDQPCSCCGRERLYAKLTAPNPPVFGFGKRLYTYACRLCDLSPSPGLPSALDRALRSNTGYDPREDPELLD